MVSLEALADHLHLGPLQVIVRDVNMDQGPILLEAFGPGLGKLMFGRFELALLFSNDSTSNRVERYVEHLDIGVPLQVLSDHGAALAHYLIVMQE